jgi:hypothetical protein
MSRIFPMATCRASWLILPPSHVGRPSMESVESVEYPLRDEDLLTQNEAAKKRRCSKRKLERERAEGRGPAYVQDRGRVYYRWGDIRRYIASLVRGPQTEPGSVAPPAAAPAAKPRRKQPKHVTVAPAPAATAPPVRRSRAPAPSAAPSSATSAPVK